MCFVTQLTNVIRCSDEREGVRERKKEEERGEERSEETCRMCFVTQLTNVIRWSDERGRRKEREGRVRRRVGCALLHNSQMSYAAVLSVKE